MDCKQCISAGGRHLGNRHYYKCSNNSAKKLKDKAQYREIQEAIEQYYASGGTMFI